METMLLQKCSSATSSGRTSPFFRLREQPNHQNTRICWGQAMSRNCLGTCLAIFGAWIQLNVESGFRCIFEQSSACGNMVIFSRVPLSFSVSLPRIWLSRSTSKIDALDDDETLLRVTASQTDTTRGVMISGIMGNSEEWIKVMDEYIVPNCTALMVLGRKFLLFQVCL